MRIVIDLKSFEKDTCNLKNIINRIVFLKGSYKLIGRYCQWENKRLFPITNARPNDTIITCSTSWSEIEKYII
jgi:hypothetical protein